VEAQKRAQACDKFLAIRERDADCVNALAGLHIASLRPSSLDPTK
jgi:hypothetical protein